METRVKLVEERLSTLEGTVRKLTDSLLGTLDGHQPGLMQTLNSSLAASQINSAKLDQLNVRVDQMFSLVDDLRGDRSKARGFIIAITVVWALLLAYMKFGKPL